MPDRVGSGQPLNILNVDGRSLELDEHGLARLLLDERVKDKPVVVIAVVGAFRKGKSFLLCFLLRYLRSKGRPEWMGDPNAPLEGFEWRGGSQRHTTGILMWNEVFLVKTSQGQELAILLMDTQGTFDCESASVVHASIFSLSAMISSLLVYNVSQNIQQNDLQHLQDFIQYGTMTQSKQQQQPSGTTAEVDCTRPFQSLMFLVRDWQFERPYGLEGGRPLLEKRLKGPRNQDKELRQLRRKIAKCFKEIRCFLMPHPGLTVYVSALKRGLLEDPSQMLAATHAGSCQAAMDTSLRYYNTEMISLWQNSPDDDADRETMERHHNKIRKEAVDKYSAEPKMGGELLTELYLDELQENIDATFKVFCKFLKEKRKTFINSAVLKHVAFKVVHGFITTGLATATIALAAVELPIVAATLAVLGATSLSGHLIQAIVERELSKRKKKERHENSKAAAEAVKRSGIGAPDPEECDDETPLLAAGDDAASVLSFELAESAMTSRGAPAAVPDDVEATEAENSAAFARALKHYSDGMQQVCGDSIPRLSEEELLSYHKVLQEYACTIFSRGYLSAGNRGLPHFLDRLTSEMEEQFKNFVNQNREKPTART